MNSKTLEISFLKNFRKRVASESAFVVACSGGVDSMVLCALLLKDRSLKNDRVTVVYLNHGQRKDAALDEKLVAQFCAGENLKFVKETLALKKGASEETMRESRYAELFKICRREKAVLLTAHHADDQLETILFKLLRGANPENFSAIADDVVIDHVRIFRPLLPFHKEDLLNYAREKKVKWREDSTNADLKYSRNFIRNVLIPSMNKVNQGGARHFHAFFSELMSTQEVELKSNYSNELISKLNSESGLKSKEVSFTELKVAITRILGSDSRRTTKMHWENTRKILEERVKTKSGGGPQKTVQFPGGCCLVFKANRLFWHRSK